MSGATLKPNMRKLGWLKKKANKKELAGKKPTKFNSTKFYELQNNLRDKESTLLQFEADKDIAEEETSAEIVVEEPQDVMMLTCGICGKQSTSEKGQNIHMTKVHGGKEVANETSLFMCKVCGINAGSERSLANHVKKSHQSTELNDSELDCDQCDKTFTSLKGLKIHKSKSH